MTTHEGVVTSFQPKCAFFKKYEYHEQSRKHSWKQQAQHLYTHLLPQYSHSLSLLPVTLQVTRPHLPGYSTKQARS